MFPFDFNMTYSDCFSGRNLDIYSEMASDMYTCRGQVSHYIPSKTGANVFFNKFLAYIPTFVGTTADMLSVMAVDFRDYTHV